jgi:hypothetical protein
MQKRGIMIELIAKDNDKSRGCGFDSHTGLHQRKKHFKEN